MSVASALAAVAVSSTLVGAGLLGRLPMPVLIGLVGCLVLPAATCLVWRLERRHRQAALTVRAEQPPLQHATADRAA